jgi:hypothetical protein
MQQITLTAEQKNKIKSALQAFSKYVKSDDFSADQTERLARVNYFQRELPRRLNELSEADIDELVVKLWASRMWGNKQYLVQQVISDNGIEKLQKEFKELLDTGKPVAVRYERFAKEVMRLGGPASLSEMLCYIQPQDCGIWNGKARQAIKALGLEAFVNPDKYRLSGEEYERFNELLRAVAGELRAAGFKDVDLLFVDFFLFQVSEETIGGKPTVQVGKAFDHDEVRDMIESIGVMLGFDACTEFPIAHGGKVDDVWRARIGNLGMVAYVFEVQKSGSIHSLLLKLQKAKSNPTVQKVIAVSDEAQLERIKDEAEGLPEEFRRSLGFWRVSEVQKVSENLQSATDVINDLGLIQGGF